MNFVERAQERFRERLTRAAGAEKQFRESAWADYSRIGLPDRRTEEWRYSSLKNITREAPTFARAGATPKVVRKLRERYRQDFDVLVVVDGQLRPDESVISAELEDCLGTPGFKNVTFDDGFTSLSAALSHGGVRLNLPPGLHVARPVLILRATGEGWSSVYNEIEVGDGADLRVAELFVGADASLRTEITRGHVGAGAKLGLLRLQNESATAAHYSDVGLRVGEGATLRLDQINAGAAWARTALTADLDAREAEACVHGITFGAADQHGDQRILVQHRAADTRSQQYFKGVLKDRARGVVNGKIFIAQDAQRVDSRQLNHALLLSPGAEADIKPELEIYADDVKANHGASIGRLDQDKLFYLVSRGISPTEAQRMLARAFVDDIVMKIASPDLRRLADDFLGDLLPSYVEEMRA